jgi:hypothetical protein
MLFTLFLWQKPQGSIAQQGSTLDFRRSAYLRRHAGSFVSHFTQ